MNCDVAAACRVADGSGYVDVPICMPGKLLRPPEVQLLAVHAGPEASAVLVHAVVVLQMHSTKVADNI
jgi:hypothetical protein